MNPPAAEEALMMTLVAVVLCGLALAVWRLAREGGGARALGETRRRLGGSTIIIFEPRARFIGFERAWDARWRGQGVLALTEEALYFRNSRGGHEFMIPMERLENARTVQENETISGSPVLETTHVGPDGGRRVARWKVREPDVWVGSMESIMERSIHDGNTADEKRTH
ncbi:MAG: hypothetical protein AB7W37_07145 [Syntrophobacteraceae bacterium]|jgi:hypothetical protein